jgi:hypothetical protein
MVKILAFAGAKQSGKNTCSNFLHGFQLKSYNVIDNFYILNDGQLITENKIDGNTSQKGLLDVNRKDDEFSEWASEDMWPLIKNYSFADALKSLCIHLFNIPYNCVYGTDEEKNTIIPWLLWENMPGILACENHNLTDEQLALSGLQYHKSGPMTAREFMQFFGTDIMRKMYENIWCDKLIKDIKSEDPGIAVISDCRFRNECEYIKSHGGKIIHLTRRPFQDGHKSENDLVGYNGFDGVIDNENMNIGDSCDELLKIIQSWGWMGC